MDRDLLKHGFEDVLRMMFAFTRAELLQSRNRTLPSVRVSQRYGFTRLMLIFVFLTDLPENISSKILSMVRVKPVHLHSESFPYSIATSGVFCLIEPSSRGSYR